MVRIAVVEDCEPLRGVLADALTGRGYEVVGYQDVETAFDELSRRPPDLLITDVALPDGSGLDLIGRLRRVHRELPVIVASGRGSEAEILRSYEAGASDFMVKPYTLDEVLAKCAVHLARVDRAGLPGEASLPGGRERAFGRYRVEAAMGEGASGVVYSALELATGRRVALKVPSLHGHEAEQRLRFLREIYALSSVRDPHVASVLDFGASEGVLYCAMEFVDGPTLERKVLDDGPASEEEALALLEGLSRAVGALQAANLVHRDIKPANVMLRDGRWDRPVLIDFGLAKRPFDRTLTQSEEMLGTPGYMSPEVVLGAEPDQRSDLFALGVLVTYALTGVEPFPELAGLQLLLHMTTHPVLLPTGLSPAFEQLLERLTSIEPSGRPDSAAELLRDLRELDTRTGPQLLRTGL